MAPRRPAAREASWNSVHHSDASDAMDQDDSPLASRRLSTVGDVRRALNPLQEHADRVGHQAEQFAETLDRLLPSHADTEKGVLAAISLAEEYERVAAETVTRLKRRHGDERRQILKQSRRKTHSGKQSAALILRPDAEDEQELEIGTSVKDLVHWEQEKHTWELLKLTLQMNSTQSKHAGRREYNPLNRPLETLVHRYSSETAVFDSLLATNDAVWERHIIAQWLARVADSADEDVYDVVEDTIGGQGSEGLVARGWTRAKEGIKHQKRLRSLNRPMEPDANEVNVLLSNQKKQAQITQLDPDAATRQNRALPSEDLAFERALWMGCWELIRRGRPWAEILDWCRDRTEAWRALSLRPGLLYDDGAGQPAASRRCRALWSQMCHQLAATGGVEDYERAVYGLLGGDPESVFKICRTWDDHLYAWLSCFIAQKSYQAFCKSTGIPIASSEGTDSSSKHESFQNFFDHLATLDSLKNETQSPFTMLQASIMSRNIPQFLTEQGSQLSKHLKQARYGTLGSDTAMDVQPTLTRITSTLSPAKHDIVRILAHIAVIYSTISPELSSNPAVENLIVTYIDYLGKAGKQQLLPLYASRLRRDRAAVCMARQLIYIKDTAERQTIMRLMKQSRMEVEVILLQQLDVITSEVPPHKSDQHGFPALKILEHRPGSEVPEIKRDFMGGQIQDWETDLIDALEWFLLLDGRWNETFDAGTIVYKHFLRTRSWAAARELARRITFSRISRMKTRRILGKEVDLSEMLANGNDHDHEDEEMTEDGETSEERRAKAEAEKEQLLVKSRTFQDLESLVLALDAIDQWEKTMHAGNVARSKAHQGDKSELRDLRQNLEKAYQLVTDSVEPLMHGWLMFPKDDDEAAETAQIRKRMLPEIILAYLSMHTSAGRWMHRDTLLQCMNLAQKIAAPEGSDICDAFVGAGRMAELTTVLANVSRQVLSADEHTGNKPLKRRGVGEVLDIWTVRTDV